jgi:fluoride exporter
MLLLYLAVGGALGTLARFAFAGWIYERAAEGFPWGTVAVNAVGSFLIGFVLRLLEVMTIAPELRAFITIGLLGGFTTFSAYSYETVLLFRDGRYGAGAIYSLGSLCVGVLAVLAGLALATIVLRIRTS